MHTWIINALIALVFLLASTCLFFFVTTRGTLLVRALAYGSLNEKSYVYPIYSNMWLIKLVDFQPLISAILLFQYHHLVSHITSVIRQSDLKNRKLLISSCAFGNIIPEVVNAALKAGAERILIVDLIHNELLHARNKLGALAENVDFIEDDATDMQLKDGTVGANVVFFLLHELPHHLKESALSEARRTLTPGGKLFLAAFHRPDLWVLRAFSWSYFKVFEPLGLALWDTHDPLDLLENMGGWSCERTTYFFGNFQIITATRL